MRRIRKTIRHNGRFIDIRETSDEQAERLTHTNTFWRKHPAPFNKSQRAKSRLVERQFNASMKTRYLDSNNHGVNYEEI